MSFCIYIPQVVATLQCGGNRRAEMNQVAHTLGSPWSISAISTAEWAGVRLLDLLRDSGMDEEALVALESAAVDKSKHRDGVLHVQFHGIDGLEASVPALKVMNPFGDVLLAYEVRHAAHAHAHAHAHAAE
jgi:sulfite oxidase